MRVYDPTGDPRFVARGPIHGRYCGWGHSPADTRTPPVDSLDALCREHDIRVDRGEGRVAHASLAAQLDRWIERYARQVPGHYLTAARAMRDAMRLAAAGAEPASADVPRARREPDPCEPDDDQQIFDEIDDLSDELDALQE